ncbi:substrate-binding domain-containing protein [Blautia sp. CLA-JM-H16]|uniref:Substrate-binding domain-containing protein n=1 Tax=Blautia aquisgranensis TaxID=3133153 RepID=A0ABV1BCS7_9FIRM
MKKKVISAILCGAMVLGTVCPVLAADDKSDDTKTEAAAGDSAKDKKIALVGKAAGNAFFEIAAKSFQETVEAEGGEVQVVYPETATADAQIKVLDNLISQDFDAICISANDVNALQAKLEEAMDAGIKVSSFDSAPNKDSREIFVNQAGTKEVAQALMDAVLDISGGEGQFAILSATSQSANQNAWIDAMKTIMEGDDKYSKLELVDVVYGDDEPQKSTDQTAALLQNYKDLKVICAPTTVGIAAAAKYLQDNGSECKLTGLGLPSEMQEYTGDDADHSCPYFYLWDMQGLGKLSAYTTIALINGDITGAKDDKFTAGDLGDYTITDADDGGTEVVLGAPLKFDTSNIEEMAKLY